MENELKWEIMKRFSLKKCYDFNVQDLAREFPEKNQKNLIQVLPAMVKAGMICKISRNIYHIIPLNADPRDYKPEDLLLAKYFMLHREYYIGYKSALDVHGVSTRKSGKNVLADVYVATARQKKPSIKSYKGTTCRFILQKQERFFGYEPVWVDNLEQVMVSDLERTIVDICGTPEYCGGIQELGSAILRTNDRLDHEKLFYYFFRNSGRKEIKRFLYLTDLLGLHWTSQHDILLREIGRGANILDPGKPDQGKVNTRFGLKINADERELKRRILHPS